MGIIPDSTPSHHDGIDLLVDACQTLETVQNMDGSVSKQIVLDPEKAWWKTHVVNSPYFARFAFELKEFERLASESIHHMTQKRAQVLIRQILEIGLGYRYSIDAKSSESLRDKQNTQSTLLDKLQKNKIERAITLKGETKNSLLNSWLGKEAQEEPYE